MYPPEQLFIWRIDELKQILANPKERNLFDGAGKLRQILLDEAPLLHQVNRNIRLTVWFIIAALTGRPNPDHPFAQGAVFSQVSIAPDPAFSMVPQRRLNLDDFLKWEVLYLNGQAATVREIIKYVANDAGAIHKGPPDTIGTKSLEEAALSFRVGDMPSVVNALLGITKVVVTACEPIYDKLRA